MMKDDSEQARPRSDPVRSKAAAADAKVSDLMKDKSEQARPRSDHVRSEAASADAKVSANAVNVGGGVSFDEVLRLPLSTSVKAAVEQARQWAERERFRGLFGTGMMLLALARKGEEAPPTMPDYAPRFFFEQLQRHGGDRFARASQRFLDENRLPEGHPGAVPQSVSPNLWRTFEEAGRLPIHDRVLAARHLIVALLTPRERPGQARHSAAAILANAGIDRELLLAEFLKSLAENGPRAERDAWAKLAAEHPLPVKPTVETSDHPTPRGPLISGYHPDTPSGRAEDDCLGLEITVNAMANLIASKQLDGTMSLGVFGNWGSGKSFFMRRLCEEIDSIAAVAREQENNGGSAYWPNIAQVEFNAWHYVDANLWASLMSHLLDVLRRWDPAGKVAPEMSPIAQAIEQLEITANARREAEAQRDAAAEAKEAADKAHAAARDDFGVSAGRLREALASSIWSFVASKVDAQRQQATEALRKLGLLVEGAETSIEALFTQVRDVVSTAGRLQTIAHGLLHDRKGMRSLGNLLLVVLVGLAAIAVGSIWADWLRHVATVVGAALTGFAAVGAKAIGWLQKTAAVVSDQIAPLRAARATIEQKLAEAEKERAAVIVLAEKEVAVRRADLDAAAAQVAAREGELRQAQQAVADAISGRAVRQFIEQRLATGDYQKHLGLIATIRRDFEQLSDLIRAHNANQRQLHQERDEIKARLIRARPELKDKEAELVAMFESIGINRIVLYIDDLDRCPSTRVVEVLQAIHLLVSFPIFVVVVGVDSRWMAHSLAREYPNLLTRAPDEDAPPPAWLLEEAHTLVTPADYLEKIFQIPFWVPPLNTPAAQRLLNKLTEAPASAVPFGATAKVPEPLPGATELPPGAGLGLGLRGVESDGSGGSIGDGVESMPGAGPTPGSRDRETPQQTQRPAMRPHLLRVADGERQAMQSLAALIGRSPRATKRFVNSYRLLKVALLAQEPERFAPDSEALGHLAGPMFLLAVVTGLPTLAAEFVRMLPDNRAVTAVDQLTALAKWAEDDRQHADAVRRIREFCGRDATQWRELAGSDLLPWTRRVAQLSFEDMVPAGSTDALTA